MNEQQCCKTTGHGSNREITCCDYYMLYFVFVIEPSVHHHVWRAAPTGLTAGPALTKRAEARRRRSNSLTSKAIAV